MKAISIRQPWANLIVHGIKDIENRTWRTNFRGRVLVHAPLKNDSKSVFLSLDQSKQVLSKYDVTGDLNIIIPFTKIEEIAGMGVLNTFAIIGSVEIVDCVRNHGSIWAMEDHWHWVLANPVKFDKPILNVKGKLSFWEYEGEINE